MLKKKYTKKLRKNNYLLNGEIMEKNKSLEKIGLGVASMFGIYWIYSVFIQNQLNIQPMFKTIIGLISLYVIGLFILVTYVLESGVNFGSISYPAGTV